MDRWKTIAANPLRVNERMLEVAAERYPGIARRYAEGVYLPAWSDAMRRSDAMAARQCLRATAVIARIELRKGDAALAESLTDIANAEHDPRRLEAIIDGEAAYVRGRLSLRDGDVEAARRQLQRAQSSFESARASMALLAGFWVASAATEAQRPHDAEALLLRIVTSAQSRGYRAWFAQSQYQLGLIAATRGDWSESLVHARAAAATFAALGDRGSTANADALLSEDFDLLGNEENAWAYGVSALHGLATDGAWDRSRVALAALCRTEMRGGRWRRVLSIAHVERELLAAAPDARLDPDMYLRLAAAEWHLGHGDAARRAIASARDAALRVADADVQRKLLADVNGTEGALFVRDDPAHAVGLLSAAITFERAAVRPITLPELYLSRGRARKGTGDSTGAMADFEAGVAELERQRRHVREADLRPGIFGDAGSLFDEAILLELKRGAGADALLRWVERGRARTILEQLRSGMSAPLVTRVADVQRALPARSALIELSSLPDGVLAIVIRRDGASVRRIPLDRATIRRSVADAVGRHDGGAIGRLLIEPLLGDLQDVNAITFVTDDEFQRVPFAAVRVGHPAAFLVENYVIASCPSASILVASARPRPPRPAEVTAAIFGNPEVPEDEFGDLPSLDAAEVEAARIAKNYRRPEVLTGRRATALAFREIAPRSSVVHFGGHAVVNQREPSTSAIVCAASAGNAGGVTARDIAAMHFPATKTVVLAACSTMTGRNAAVEGVTSLARAFVAAGVPEVVGTLWDVDDRDAAPLTAQLHEQLARGVSADAALRSAQLVEIRAGLPPSKWAAFAVIAAGGAKAEGPPSRSH